MKAQCVRTDGTETLTGRRGTWRLWEERSFALDQQAGLPFFRCGQPDPSADGGLIDMRGPIKAEECSNGRVSGM